MSQNLSLYTIPPTPSMGSLNLESGLENGDISDGITKSSRILLNITTE